MLLGLVEKMVDCLFAVIPQPRPSPRQIKQALVIAHRGAHDTSQGIIENTLPAFERAKALGCWGIELDVHSTADGVFVVHHDRNLKRLWQHNATIDSLTFKELRARAPDIPLLAEVIALYKQDLHLFIELKAPVKHSKRLQAILKDCKAIEDYHVISLEPAFFNPLSFLDSRALLLVAGHNNVRQLCELSLSQHYGGLLGNYLLCSAKIRAQLKQAHQYCGVGFIDSKNTLYRELNRNMIWLFTNKAQQLSQYLTPLQTL